MSPPRKKGKKGDATKPPPKGLYDGVIRLEVGVSSSTFADNSHYWIGLSGLYKASKWMEIGGVKWQAKIYQYADNAFGRYANLAISLKTEENPSPLWSIDVESQFVLIHSDNAKNVVKEKTHTFNSQSQEWKDIIVPWKDLGKRTNSGYYKDGKLIVIINFAITKKTGFRSTPNELDFTDSKEPSHDVALVIGGEKIYANKAILASHSPLFYAMFYGDSNDKDKKEFELKDVDMKEFIEMLHVIYPFHKKVSDENVKLLLKLGDRFEFIAVLDLVETHLIYSSDLKLVVKLLLSETYRLIKLQGHCINKMDSDQWDKSKSSVQYKKLSDGLKKAVEVVLERKKPESSDSENSEY